MDIEKKVVSGEKFNITKSVEKDGGELTEILLGAGWNENPSTAIDPTTGKPFTFDADLAVAFLNAEGKLGEDTDLLWYKSAENAAGKLAVGDYAYHTGDNLNGEGEGDDEAVRIDLSKIPAAVTTIKAYVTIYDYERKKQNFGMMEDAFVRVASISGEVETPKAKMDLEWDEAASSKAAVLFCTFQKRGTEWVFVGNNTPLEGGFQEVINSLK